MSINEVNGGCSSDNLKSYKLKKFIDKKNADEMVRRIFNLKNQIEIN